MHAWLDFFALYLAMIVGAVYLVEFLLGKDGNKRIHDGLLKGWYFFSRIPVRTLGWEEAKFTLQLLDRYIGPNLFSARRFVTSLMIVCAGITSGYILIEFLRWHRGLPFHVPFSREHFSTGFPFQVPAVMISLSVTRWLLSWSVHRLSETNYSTLVVLPSTILLALITFFASEAVSALAEMFIGAPLGNMFYHSIPNLASGDFSKTMNPFRVYGDAWNYLANNPDKFEVSDDFFFALPFMNQIGRFVNVQFTSPYFDNMTGSYFQLYLALADKAEPRFMHSLVIGWFTNGFRIVIGAAFFTSWILAYFFYKPIELVLRRLAESDRPPLGHVALALSGLAKIIQMISKGELI